MAFDFPASPSEGQIYNAPGGPQYIYKAPVWKVNDPAATFLSSIVRYLVATSGTYNKPAGLKFLEVIAVGGGGGSTGSGAITAGQSVGGGGGAGGGTCISFFAAASIGATEAYTVGAGGVASGNGGTTQFKSMIAGGGGGGGAGIGPSGVFQVTGRGANGSPSGGDINIYGGAGNPSLAGAHGLATIAFAGEGGGSYLAPQRPGTWTGNGAVPAISGFFPGGGANGTAISGAGGPLAGAAGGLGCIIFTEYF